MPRILENDAFALARGMDSMDEAQRPQALDILARYKQQQDDNGEPEWPSQAQARQADSDRLRGFFDDLKTVDAAAPSLAAVLPYSENPDADRARVANTAYLATRYGKTADEIGSSYELWRDDYATRFLQAPKGLDDLAFHASAANEIKRVKQKEDTEAEGVKAALRGDDVIPSLQAWQAKNLDRMPDSTEFTRGFLQARERAGEHLEFADVLLKQIESNTGLTKGDGGQRPAPASREMTAQFEESLATLATMKPRDRKQVYAIIGAKAEAAGYDQKGFWSQMLSELGKGTARMGSTLTTQAGVTGDVLANLPAMLSNTMKPEEFAATDASIARRQGIGEMYDEIAGIVAGGVDPVKPVISWLNDSVETGLIKGPGAVAPFMMVSAATGFLGGSAIMTADFAEQRRRDLRAEGWDNEDATALGMIEAPFLAGIESLSNMTQLGRFPAVQRVLSGLTKPIRSGSTAAVVRYGQNTLASLGLELTEENLQTHVVGPVIEKVAAAFDESLPQIGMGELWNNINANVKKSFPELFWTIAPMALVFGGMMTAAQANLSAAAISSQDMLEAAGYSAAQANQVRLQTTEEAKISKARELWGARAGTPQSIEAAAKTVGERMRMLQGDAIAAQKDLESRGILPRMLHASENAWKLTFNDGSTADFNSHREADAARWQWATDQLGKVHLATREALAQLERGSAVGREFAVEFKPDAMTAQMAVAEGRVDASQIQRRVQQGAAVGESAAEPVNEAETFDNAVATDKATSDYLASLQILGSSSNEFKDGVLRTTIKLYEGANVLTLVEEKLEGDAKQIVASKPGREWMLTKLREYERVSGDSLFRKVADDSELQNDDLIEAWSSLGQSYLVGKSKKGAAIGKGGARRIFADVLKAGMGGAMNSETQFFNAVWRRAAKLSKLKREGKLGADITAELERQLGIDSQAKFESEAAKDAEAIANEALNVGGTSYSEENPGPNGETFSMSRAVPADASKIVQMPDGAQLVGPTTFSIRAFHGTPHKVDKFSTSKIGTGEGAQAYGYGLYMASSREVAESYRKNLSGDSATQARLRAGMPAASDKSLSDRESVYLENLSKTLVTESLISKRFSQLDIPSRSVFVAEMVRIFDNLEILDAVIRLVPVDVVNMLGGKQYSAEYLRSNPTMLVYLLSSYADNPVSSGVEAVNVLSAALTIAGAKAQTGFAGLEKLSSEDVSALRAGKFDHVGKIPQPSEFIKGNLYTVELLPDESEFLDWDKPLSEQSEKVRAILVAAGLDGKDGRSIYISAGAHRGFGKQILGGKEASEHLASLGIPGIRYLDGNSRDGGSGTSNYVIFDESLVKILEENGKPVEQETFSISKMPVNAVAAKDAFESAVKRFGLTRDITEAGYILPDGRLLDFSGRADAGYVRRGDFYFPADGGRDWMKGSRGTDHREVEWEGMPPYKETWMPMVEFMRMGAVRIDQSGAITLHGRNGITAAQKSRLADLLIESDGNAFLDMEDDDGKRASISMGNAKIGKLAGFIQKWKDGWTPDAAIETFSLRAVSSADARFRFDGIAKEDPINDGSRVGTAWQGKVKPTTQDTNNGIATVTPKGLKKQMGMLTQFIDGVPLPKYITDLTDPTERMRAFIAFQKGNLLALYDAFEKLSPDYVVRSTHWYDGARLIAERIRDSYNLTVEQSSAIIAVFSPMKDWFQNVAMGQRFADIMANYKDTVITNKGMRGAVDEMVNAAENGKYLNDALKLIDGRTIADLLTDKSEGGRKLAAVAVRLLSTHVHGLTHDVLTPEGESMGVRKNLDGSNKKMVWQSYAFIVKAISIYENGSLENISKTLGTEHKIRNFYNNIISPTSPFGDATVDTHAVNAAVLFPMGGSAYLTTLNFGKAGMAGGGNSGLYWLFHEALREAAAERGVLPRQMQSITWEAIRGLFPDTMKRNKKFVAKIVDIWESSPDAESARSRILELGITPPEWARVGSSVVGSEAGMAGNLGQAIDSERSVRSGIRQGRKSGPSSANVGQTFSIRSGDFASRMSSAFSPFQRNPELRMAIAQVAKARAQKLGAEWIEKAAVIRGAGDIGKESRMREALAYEARMNEYLDGLSEAGRLNLEFEPASLADDPLIAAMLDHGKLMSRSTAIKNGVQNMDEYEGAPWLPPAWYSKGVGITPGKMAKALHEGADGNGGPLTAGDSAADLWNAIDIAITSTRKNKAAHREAVTAYKAAQKYAKDSSRAEADKWAEGAKKKATSPKAQRDMLKGALRLLDGILAAAPPEVRARVGGYVKLAGLATDEAMLQEIERRIEKLNVELEKWLKKEGVAEIQKLFKKARPDSEAGKRGKGKDADMHALFAAAERASQMDAVAVAGELARLDSLIAGDTLTPEQEVLAITERGIVELVGDLKHADAGRVYSALDTLRDIYQGGWLKWKLAQIEKREERAGMRGDFIADTGKRGIKPERDAAEREAETMLGKIKGGFLSLSSFHEVLSYAFGSKSDRVKSLVDAEREASGQYEDANQAIADEIQDLFTALAGGKVLDGEKLRFDMAQRTIQTAKGELSQLGAIQALLMWRQEDGRRHMEGQLGEDGKPISLWSYDQAWVDEITAQLTPEARQVMAWIMQKYGAEHAVLNPLYRSRYGVNMPAHDNYAPITVQPVQAKAGEVIDPVSGAAMSSGSILTPGSLRTRSRNAIAEPEFRDALQTLLMHTRQLEYWKAYYDLALESSAILGNREVLNAVKAKGGEQAATALRKWIDAIAQGGFRDASASLEMNKMLQRMTGRAASVGLLGRFSTLLVQSTQLAAASVKMPLGSYLVGMSKLLTGNLAYADAIRSPFIQRRYKSAPPIVRQAMDSLAAATRPNQIKRATRALGQLLSGTDALFTAGTYALLLDYHRGTGRALGLTGAELEEHAHTEAERDTEQVAQPTRMATRSLAELTSTNPLAKVSWAYASEARQKIALMAWATTKAASEPAQFAKTAFLVFGVGGLMTQVLKGLWREAKGDDDEKKWSVERLTLAALTGPLHGVPLASELMGDQGMLSGVAWAWPALKDVASGEADMRDVDTLLSTLGMFNDTAAGVASMAHAGLDAAKVIQNLADEN